MNPSLDVSEITALLSAQIMLEAVGFLHHR
jgi:hypothetical protein